MPHKFNAARRHKFDKAQYRVINWAEYNESLRQRGDLTIWVSDEAQSVRGWIRSFELTPSKVREAVGTTRGVGGQTPRPRLTGPLRNGN